ncbi:hypothetical protein [Methanomethylophilus alvi]|uniref:hypothetical protein n=1 Tax=Methanomethylophilus alvi TaxID=1291540 RepID=UPI0037DCA268
MTRRCPNCGAVVPKGSLTCPQCYTEVPRDDLDQTEPAYGGRKYERPRDEYERQLKKRKKSLTVALILAVVPAFFGILGLGQIYEDRRDSKGWKFLVTGLVFFIILVSMIVLLNMSGILGAIMMAVPLILFGGLYICTAIASVADVYLGSLRIFGLR